MEHQKTSNEHSVAEFTEHFINQTNRSVFLTGKAGTGKTTLLRKIVASTYKNTVIVAPTGIAALNAGGVTIHSFFQLPFGTFIPDFETPPGTVIACENKTSIKRHFNMNKRRLDIIRSLELLIVDEVSMLRCDLLDAMDWTLRTIRKTNEPFGGVQVLFIGDLFQLPPVVKNEEWNVLRNYYGGIHFFHAQVFMEERPVFMELDKIYRQDDATFIQILNNLRENRLEKSDVERINQNVISQEEFKKLKGYITLTTHNAKADEINEKELLALKEKSFFYEAEIEGEFPQHMYPIGQGMELKVGAQIMFIKNDISFDKNFYNGKMGVIDFLGKEEIIVHFPDEKKKITVEKFEWNNIRYTLDSNTQEIKEEILGTFVHYPIRLAWAITVHKSQGLTFDKAVLDVGDAFAPGQAYVAFSRLRSLEGLRLLRPLVFKSIATDSATVAFTQNKTPKASFPQLLESESAGYLKNKLKQRFDWYELKLKWSVHNGSYALATPKSEKAKQATWSKGLLQEIESLHEPAVKFGKQLDQLFGEQPLRLDFIAQRVDAAYDYFFAPFDKILLSVYRKIAELKLVKKTRQFTDELEELSEEILFTILELKKAKLLMRAVADGVVVTKNLFEVPEIQNYKITKIALIENEFRNQKVEQLWADENTSTLKIGGKKKAAEKKEKKNTYEITLELLEKGMKPEDIARERQLSLSTVNSHFVQLLKTEKIELSQVLPNERIIQLESLLEGINESSLSRIMEEVEGAVTYDELKLYQASKML